MCASILFTVNSKENNEPRGYSKKGGKTKIPLSNDSEEN